MRNLCLSLFVLSLICLNSCKTKDDLRAEQELSQFRQEMDGVRTQKADLELQSEELKIELSRLSGQIERVYNDNQKLKSRVEALESQVLELKTAPPKVDTSSIVRPAANYEQARALFESGQFEDAIPIFKEIIRTRSQSDEGRKSTFLLAESYFSNKEYALATLEYSKYKKDYPKDPLLARATYRQANCFRLMNKNAEAKLFYQELIEKFPKDKLTSNAKKELKTLK